MWFCVASLQSSWAIAAIKEGGGIPNVLPTISENTFKSNAIHYIHTTHRDLIKQLVSVCYHYHFINNV